MNARRRRLLVALCAAGCAPSRAWSLDEELEVAQKDPATLAIARFSSDWSGKTNVWTLILAKEYRARWTAILNRYGYLDGRMSGEFGFYGLEYPSESERQQFLGLSPRGMVSRTLRVHTAEYMIGLRRDDNGPFHRVRADFWTARNPNPSEDLKFFFSLWRRLWAGIPAAPQGHRYEG